MRRQRVNLRRRLLVTAVVAVPVCMVAISPELGPSTHREVVAIAAAAINASPTTVAIADSDTFGMTQADVDRTMDAITASNVKSVRLFIPWAGVEASQGQLDWTAIDKTVNSAAARGLAVVGIVNSTPAWAVKPGGQPLSGQPASNDVYAAFVGKVATRYLGKISALEIWNEPNAFTFWTPKPDAAAYVQLLRTTYPVVKAVDPTITVIGGVLGSIVDFGDLAINPVTYLQQMYAAGAQGYFDAFSFHPYHYSLKFSDGVTVANSPVQQLIQMRLLMVSNGDASKRIWSTEYGEPASSGGEAQENTYLTDMLTKWQELPYVGPMYIYTTRDRNTGSLSTEDTLGIYRTDWTPKTVQAVVATAAAGGLSKAPEFQRFATVTDASLGTVLSPVYRATPQVWAQIRTVRTIYELPSGFVTSPNPVADKARGYGVAPKGEFANGYQDFDNQYGLRIWYSPETCARAAGGGIANAWTPDLGLAVSDEMSSPGGAQMNFQHGTITWSAVGGAQVTRVENPTPTSCQNTGGGSPVGGNPGGGYPGPDPGLASPLLAVLELLSNILSLPGRLLAPQ
jgi:polysaccharide biosynthesis protein PslG